MFEDKRPLRLKILKGISIESLELKYNEFAAKYDIAFSQYQIAPDGNPTMAIWFRWDEATSAYEEVKNDPKIMGDEK